MNNKHDSNNPQNIIYHLVANIFLGRKQESMLHHNNTQRIHSGNGCDSVAQLERKEEPQLCPLGCTGLKVVQPTIEDHKIHRSGKCALDISFHVCEPAITTSMLNWISCCKNFFFKRRTH